MKRGWRLGGLVALPVASWLLACATPAPPPIFARLESARSAPASLEAEQWAPQARAHALGLERRARQALEDGDDVRAELLAETSLAAHERARVLTRRARAERRRANAESQLDGKQRALTDLHAQHQRLIAEAEALELRARVLRDAMPLPEHQRASPERRRARLQAAGALASQARLLCLAARMLESGAAAPDTLAELAALEEQLGAGAPGDALELATRLRSECLAALSNVRRRREPGVLLNAPPESNPTPATPADVLLSALSDSGDEPSRDDRGVSVVLRGAFGPGGELSVAGRTRLARLARVARAHPEFPLLLVGHAGAPAPASQVDERLTSITQALSELGVSRVGTHNAGRRQPLLPRSSRQSGEFNERVELVFVAPGL